jgi:hypothetical protein
MPGITVIVNGERRDVQAPGDTPLLYVLRNELELSGPQFGCGLSQCGACSVLVDGKESRSCVLPVSRVAGKGSHHARRTFRSVGQATWSAGVGAAERCTRCSRHGLTSSIAVRVLPERHDYAAELLDTTPSPTMAQIKTAFTAGDLRTCAAAAATGHPRCRAARGPLAKVR